MLDVGKEKEKDRLLTRRTYEIVLNRNVPETTKILVA